MNKTRLTIGIGSIMTVAYLGACTANIHDNTVNIPDATLQFDTDVDVENVMPDQTVLVAVDVKNVYLIEPGTTPPPEHVIDAGHLVFTLDDEANPPLLVTAQTNVEITIPADTMPGKHKVICRVHKHDNTPTDTKFELEINVKASVSVSTSPDGGTSVDASVSVSVEAGTAAPTPTY
jgi:hypothetical protein